MKGRARGRTALATEIITVAREGEEREREKKGARGKRRASEKGGVILATEAISVARRPEEREKNSGRKREGERERETRGRGRKGRGKEKRRRECGERKRRGFLLAPLLATEKFPSREREGKRENLEEKRAQRKVREKEVICVRERKRESERRDNWESREERRGERKREREREGEKSSG